MSVCRYILPLLLTMLFSFSLNASEELKDQVEKILRLKIPADEVTDSAQKVILRYETDAQKAGKPVDYDGCKTVLEQTVLPYALKKRVADSSLAHIYDEIGRLAMTRGSAGKDDAEASLDKGIGYALKAGDWFRLGRLLEHQGFNEIKYGDQVKGFELSQKAIDAYKKSETNADRYITRCYYMQAVVYLQLGDMDGMAKVIEVMEKFVPAESGNNRLFHLYNLYSVQEAYFANMMSDASDPKKKKNFADLFNEVNLKTVLLIDSAPLEWRQTSVNPSWNYFNRASMFINTNERPPMDSVIYYCDKALGVDHYNKGDADIEIMISTSMVIAEGWMKNGDYPKATGILFDALDKMREQKDVNNLIQDRVQMYELLRNIAVHFGKTEDALAYSDSVRMLESERFSIEKTTAVKDLEVKYETQKKELALAQSESRRSATLMWLFIALGLILFGVIAFIVYADRQRRRRLQKEVEFTKLRADVNRQLTQQYVEGLENERKRMARELHDGVCNDLLAIRMGIAEGKDKENTARLLDDCRESVRRISHELMPPEFAYASLDEVVRFFIRKQADANKGKIEFSYSSSAEATKWSDLPDSVSLEIYRIVQEAVGNAIKHSGCDFIQVGMYLDGEDLLVTIADNGHFLVTRDKGFGLHSIRKRAEAVGGSIRIDSRAADSGADQSGRTTVSLSLRVKKVRN